MVVASWFRGRPASNDCPFQLFYRPERAPNHWTPGGSRTLITATGCPGLMDYRAQANLAMGPDRSLMQNFQSGHLAAVGLGGVR